MTFILMLAATAAAAVAVALVAYWLTVLALRTLDRLAPYWYVRYIVAGRKPEEQCNLTVTRLEDGQQFTGRSVVVVDFMAHVDNSYDCLYDWRSEPDGS